ncbi:Ig-like domain-containing protein, partial [Moritella sp. Urea-trap-13]|uniref:Ig-like domain-containing protein n=1 Tax=Moritella sp. Urea-trap-13 TaxID=2058327 RepID=UPI000CB86443
TSDTATVTVTDSVDTTTATLSVDHSSINEDGALLTYTVTLDNAANNDVTVTTTQGEITIYAKGSVLNGVTQDGLSGSLVIMVNTDDSNNNIVITNSISDVSEAHAGETGSYEKLTADTGTVSTIVDITPPIAIDDPIQTISGLKGEYWGYNDKAAGHSNLNNYQQIQDYIAANKAEINFISTEVDYHKGDKDLADDINSDGIPSNLISFLNDDASSIEGSSTEAATDGIIKLSGKLNITEGGKFSLNLTHDDGFVVIIDGKEYTYNGNTSSQTTQFNNIALAAGEHTVEVYYWDQGGAYVFEMELNDSNNQNVWVEENLSHSSSRGVIEVNEGGDVDIDILGNDSEQQGVTITIESEPVHGVVTINDNGTVTYQATGNYSGNDSFTYTLTDAAGNVSNVATVSIGVQPEADQPMLSIELGDVESGTITTNIDMDYDYYAALSDHELPDNIIFFNSGSSTSVDTIRGYKSDDKLVFNGNSGEADILPYVHDSNYILMKFNGKSSYIKISGSNDVEELVFDNGIFNYQNGVLTNISDLEQTSEQVEGYEIELNISGAVTDTDSSEVITSYTISGIPSDASLTAGELNNDGTWTLTPAEAADVKVIVETDYPAFDVSVVANITDTAVIDGETVTSELTSDPVVVPVSPLAIVNVDQTISVNDDMTPDTNVIIVLDISGSMKGDTFTEATNAIKALLATYDDKTNASIQIIGFEYKTIASVWFSGDDMLGEANKFIGKLSADGGTSYKDALEKVMSEFEKGITNGDVDPSDPTDVYFISDGAPSDGYGVKDDVEADWIAFTKNYNIDNVYTVGIDVSTNEKQDVIDNLTPISLGNAPIILDDPAELTKVLQDSLNANYTGNFLAGVSAALDAEVASVTINGTRYSFDGEKTITWDNPNNAPTSTTDTSAAIETTYGIFEIDFATGSYTFIPNDVDQDQTEIIAIELRDAEGNTVDGQLNIEIKDVVSGNNANSNIVTDIDSNPYVLSELIADTETQAGHKSANKYNAGDTDDYIYDSSHNGVKSKLNGGDGDDLLSGLGKNDTLNGEAGNDILLGGNDNDTLNGGTDNDILIGGTGNDILTGGSGIDTFVWLDGTVAVPATDLITDFNILEDKIDLSDLLQGVNSDDLGDYLDLSFGSDTTTISIHAKGDSSSVSQVIILDNVDLSAAYPDVDFTSTAGINSILNDVDDILI